MVGLDVGAWTWNQEHRKFWAGMNVLLVQVGESGRVLFL